MMNHIRRMSQSFKNLRLTHFCIRSILEILSILFILFIPFQNYAQSHADVNKQVKQALLAENWVKVAELLNNVDVDTPSPVARLIKGHAFLTLNRNNESLCLFSSVISSDSILTKINLQAWLEWAQMFVKKDSNNPVSYYFLGDALARQEKWDDAIEIFTKGLAIDPDHSLILNARGLSYAIKKDWDNAVTDLTKATLTSKQFADAYTNMGAMWILKNDGALGAEKAFDESIEISPSSSIALYGRGCVRAVQGKWDDARSDLEDSRDNAGCVAGYIYNSIALSLNQIQNAEEQLIAQTDTKNPSFEIQRRLSAMERNGNTGFGGTDYKALVNIAKQNPQYQTTIRQGLERLATSNPDFSRNLYRTQQSVTSHNRLGQILSNIASGFNIATTTKISGAVAVPGAIAGGSVERGTKWYNAAEPTKRFGTELGRNLDAINRISPTSHNASGFKTGLEEAVWDEGNWPFIALNGLFYNTNIQ